MPPTLSLDVPLVLIKDPRSWTIQDVSVWLSWLGIEEHVEAFAAAGVDGPALLRLGAESAWDQLGVSGPSQQRALDSAVEPLRCFRDADGAESGLALHAVEGPVAGEVFLVGAGGITGGRHSTSNDVVLSENCVSRRHFQIICDATGQHLLQDVGSTTGTFFMVRDELLLEDLMILQLGTTELMVRIEGERCTLEAIEGPDRDAQATVPPQGLCVGRESSNGFCIRDPEISGFHCEVRFLPDRGFVLDDKYSTNRTWLRLAPDGQPSPTYPLREQDLFKVGSTLFHVVDPALLTSEAAASAVVHHHSVAADGGVLLMPMTAAALTLAPPLDDAPEGPGMVGPGLHDSGDDGEPRLLWEPFVEGEFRPQLSPEEYAERVTASRRRMHTESSARRTPMGDPHLSQDAGVNGLRERELSSLQQRMRNSRAQTAYTLQQQQRHPERGDEEPPRAAGPERRGTPADEDLCKICYDHDIDVVLYPCGHFILCRWCAQKVSDCPVCRQTLVDVIRTYKA